VRTLPAARDPDAALTPAQRADGTAYSAFLRTSAAPLLALSLYVSSANWAGATRPAYSSMLPFPLTWMEPPAVRAAMEAKAEHLGFSSLDTDSDPAAATDQDHHGSLFQIPERLRTSRNTVTSSLTPEQRARIRLDATAKQCLDVLSDLLGDQGHSFQYGMPPRLSSLDCLAYGYLALMVTPKLPQPWLRRYIRKEQQGLHAFVQLTNGNYFQQGELLPWAAEPARTSGLDLTARVASGLVQSILPAGLGARWWYSQGHITRKEEEKARPWEDPTARRHDLLLALCTAAACVAVAAGVAAYRSLPPLGAPLYRWETTRRGLGAAGAMLGLGVGGSRGFASAGGFAGGSRGLASSEFDDVSFGGEAKVPVADVALGGGGVD